MNATAQLPFADYAAIEAANWSTLKILHADSPMHYKAELDRRAKGGYEDTAAKARGRAGHAVTLEPDEFPRRYVVMSDDPDPSMHRGRKEGKARWAEWLARHPEDADLDADDYRRKVFMEANPGRELISRDEYDRCIAIRNAVRSHPVAARYLEGIRAEVAIQWTERVHLEGPGAIEIPCKARIDIIADELRVVADLKTYGRRLRLRKFIADAEALSYFHQLAFYRRGIQRAMGLDLTPVIIAVESEAPHDVGVFPIHASDLQACDEEITALLIRLAHHRATDTWPGRHPEERVIERPRWAYPDEGGGGFEVISEEA